MDRPSPASFRVSRGGVGAGDGRDGQKSISGLSGVEIFSEFDLSPATFLKIDRHPRHPSRGQSQKR